jgi:subfamily B ATP-binding cassette protein MsbA
MLEGVGLTFIIPIIELVQMDAAPGNVGDLTAVFVTAYRTPGIPFFLVTVIAGVSLAMISRYTLGFLLGWSRGILQLTCERYLQRQLFESALETRIPFSTRKDPTTS